VIHFPGGFAFAQSEDIDNETGEYEHRQYGEWEQKFIDANIKISNWLDSMAESIDLWFVGRKLTRKENETQGKITNSTFINERNGTTNSFSSGLNVRFPNVEQYWQLKFTDYDERKERLLQQRPKLRQTPREKNYGATVGIWKKLGNVQSKFEPRVELRDPLKVSHLLAFESEAEAGRLRAEQRIEFYADPDKGTGSAQYFNFRIALQEGYSLSLVNEGDYEDKLRQYSVSNGISIGQSLNQKMNMSYGVFFGSVSRPSYHLDSFGVAISFSHIVYRRILDYSVTPQINFYKEFAFTGEPGLSLNVNLQF
jgi:hypothetical protein